MDEKNVCQIILTTVTVYCVSFSKQINTNSFKKD